jgi:signal transduction histidine kinase
MMSHRSPKSIRNQLIRIGLLTTTTALVLTFVILLIKELADLRRSLVHDLQVQAKILGVHSAPALIFQDSKAATETLATLKFWPHIRYAVVYGQDGQILSTYIRPDVPFRDLPKIRQKEGVGFTWTTLTLVQPVFLEKRPVGTIVLQSDLKRFYGLIARYWVMLSMVLLLSLGVAYFLLSKLNRTITTPLNHLIALMGTISREKNYALRAPVMEETEWSALAQGFNEMLDQIQQRDWELELHRRHLKEEVEKRTRDLAVANIRLEKELADRKQAEKEKSALEEQLRQSQKMEAIGRLAGGVAHDFNNLLTIILGYCELAVLKSEQGESVIAEIEQIYQAGNRASDLTRQLLAFSRRQLLEMRPVDLNELLTGMQGMLSRILGEDIRIEFHLGSGVGRIRTDPGQIEQVILNLVVNARDAMPYGGKLIFETCNMDLDKNFAQSHPGVTPGPYVLLTVTDTGLGMTPEIQERIFEPFFTTKELGKGTGLGLSTIYGIIKQCGGNIWVHSELSKGTTFEIYLPRIEESDGFPVGEEPLEPRPLGKETVLVVEDEQEVGRIIKRSLEALGYQVLLAGGGQEALRLIEGTEPSRIRLLITDVVMPGMSGRELSDRLTALYPHLKVIFMSGYTDDAVIRHGVSSQEMNFIQKPFSLNTLAGKVRWVLEAG